MDSESSSSFGVRPIGRHIVAFNASSVAFQLLIGALILYPRSRRVGLGFSIPWALGVWSVGEAFGGLFSGFAMAPTGAPGAALMYALVALVIYPRNERRRRGSLASSPAAAGLLAMTAHVGCGALSGWAQRLSKAFLLSRCRSSSTPTST